MKRKIVVINEELCDGCGNCVIACSEGALQIIGGKARLVKEDFCDGFGDCIGECPTGALFIEEREAKPFDEEATKEYLLQTKGIEAVLRMQEAQKKHINREKISLACGCPRTFVQIPNRTPNISKVPQNVDSCLKNWPVQINLLPVNAPYYEGTDLLISADCCAYAYSNFHNELIKGRTLAIGCPKLDNAQSYLEKLIAIFSRNNIKSVTVAYMEVPCCMGLVKVVEEALKHSKKDIPLMHVKIGVKGEILLRY